MMPIMMGVLPGAREQTLLRNGVCHVLPTVKVQNLAAGSAAPAIRILCVKVWPEDLILTPYEGQHLREFGMVDSEADDAPLVEQRPKLTLASLVGGSTGCNLTGVCVFFQVGFGLGLAGCPPFWVVLPDDMDRGLVVLFHS